MKIRSCVVASLLLLGCSDDPPPNTILVGAVYDRSGISSDPARVDGFNLGILHVNEGLRRAGYKNLQLEVRLEDGASQTALVVSRAVHLAQDLGVKVLSIDVTQASIDANSLAYDADPNNDLNVPIVCSSCTGTNFNLAGKPAGDPASNNQKWLLRTVMSNRLVTQVMVQYLRSQGPNGDGDVNGDGRFKLVTYATSESFGTSSAASTMSWVEMLFPPAPPPIVEQLSVSAQVDVDSYDFGTDLAAIQDNKTDQVIDVYPDYVFSFLLNQVNTAFVRTARNSGFTLPVLFANTSRLQTTINTLGNQSNGMSGISQVYVQPGPSADLFRSAYESQYGVEAPYRTANFYDAAILIGLAIVKATATLDDPTAVTGAEVKDALWEVMQGGGEPITAGPEELARAIDLLLKGTPVNYSGASGPLDIDGLGNIRQNLARWEVVDRQFVDKEIYNCIADDDCKR